MPTVSLVISSSHCLIYDLASTITTITTTIIITTIITTIITADITLEFIPSVYFVNERDGHVNVTLVISNGTLRRDVAVTVNTNDDTATGKQYEWVWPVIGRYLKQVGTCLRVNGVRVVQEQYVCNTVCQCYIGAKCTLSLQMHNTLFTGV